MKKISDLIRPFLGIVFGALLLLVYLNYFGEGSPATSIVLGVFAVIIACYYLGSAIVIFIFGDKLPVGLKTIFDALSISLFPTLMFISSVIDVIDYEGQLGVTGWIIMSASLVGSLAFAALYFVATFVKAKIVERLAFLFGSIFFLSLVLSVLFTPNGGLYTLAGLPLVILALYAIYSGMLFNALMALGKKRSLIRK